MFRMLGDLLVARPLGLVVATVGTAAFVVSLPVSVLGGPRMKPLKKWWLSLQRKYLCVVWVAVRPVKKKRSRSRTRTKRLIYAPCLEGLCDGGMNEFCNVAAVTGDLPDQRR